MQKIRVLVIDDHAGMQDGISAILNAQPDIVVAGEASDGRQAIERFRELQPDVSLVDWNLPVIRGEEVIATLCREFPNARFIVITALSGDDCLQRAIELGAQAYLHKNRLRCELLGTIRAVHEGQQYFPDKTLN
jgi:two-component system NarL family response regulator